MEITSIQYTDETGDNIVVHPYNRHMRFPSTSWASKVVQAWLDAGNTIDPYVPPPEPTVDEVYDQALLNNQLIKALVLALNDGTFVPGSNYTVAGMKTRIKSKM